MAEQRDNTADVHGVSAESSLATFGPDWDTEDAYWQSAYPERPYARADRGYEYYRSAYRFGAGCAARMQGREWDDAEPTLCNEWSSGEQHGPVSTWDEMKDAIRDAWDHVRGRSSDDRTHIR